MEKRRPKLDDVLEGIRRVLDTQGVWMETKHAQERMIERGITRMEIRHVLANGWREKRKDTYREDMNDWNYAVRGKTLDGDRELRLLVCVGATGLLLITAIDLGQ